MNNCEICGVVFAEEGAYCYPCRKAFDLGRKAAIEQFSRLFWDDGK